jgi:4-hydroxy-tetrahydrodipicolinate reductase
LWINLKNEGYFLILEELHMKLALIGYGKMGKEIEKIAQMRGHEITLIIDIHNQGDFTAANLQRCDVAIEFTRPESAVGNYLKCFEARVPVASGTTGWYEKKDEVFEKCISLGGTFFYASNFSIGVNLFFELNRKLAALMNRYPEYHPSMTEIHHTQKLDAPSGTAISLASDLIEFFPEITGWVNHPDNSGKVLGIVSQRIGDVPGIHTIRYESEADIIEITHNAKSRKGFALGSVLAAEFCLGRKGIYTMKDLLNI